MGSLDFASKYTVPNIHFCITHVVCTAGLRASNKLEHLGLNANHDRFNRNNTGVMGGELSRLAVCEISLKAWIRVVPAGAY